MSRTRECWLELRDFLSTDWASGRSFLLHPDAMDTETWYGTVPVGFMDRTGLIYRRNRYYDPSSEQFTQPDPIGMSGGLGIYAYVGGDPVNGGDPYGLSDTQVVPDPCDHYPYAFQCGGGAVPWGLQGADVAHETIDMCAIDEQACGRKGVGRIPKKHVDAPVCGAAIAAAVWAGAEDAIALTGAGLAFKAARAGGVGIALLRAGEWALAENLSLHAGNRANLTGFYRVIGGNIFTQSTNLAAASIAGTYGWWDAVAGYLPIVNVTMAVVDAIGACSAR